MKFEIDVKKLKGLLKAVGHAIPKSYSMPILNCVALSVVGGKLTAITTNMELTIKHTADVILGSDGECVVDYKLITTALKAVKEGIVAVDASRVEGMRLAFGDSSMLLSVNLFADFPISVAEYVPVQIFTIDNLPRVLKTVIPFAQASAERPTLEDVKFKLIPGQRADIAATNSYHLLLAKTSHNAPAPLEFHVSARYLKAVSGNMVIIAKKHVIFNDGMTQTICRLNDLPYPNLEKAIPQETSTQFTFNKQELLNLLSVAQAGIKAERLQQEARGIRKPKGGYEDPYIRLYTDGEYLHVGNVGKIPCTVDGNPVNAGYSIEYLTAGLNQFNACDMITIRYNTHLSPCLINSDDLLYVLTPVRLTPEERCE